MVNEGINNSCLQQNQFEYCATVPACGGRPFISILEQPSSRHRFRYGSEKGSHGSLKGQSNAKKSCPIIRLENFQLNGRRIYARASLYTADNNPERHINMLSGKKCKNGICEVEFNPTDYTAKFQELGITHFKKCEAIKLAIDNLWAEHSSDQVTDELQSKIAAKAKEMVERMRLDAVRLCFEAFYHDSNGTVVPVCEPIFSEPVYHCNSNKLKIVRIDRTEGLARGGDTIFILCNKIDQKNIKVRMYEQDDTGAVIWEDFGSFAEADVHYNVAIVFQTPPYKDRAVKNEVRVNLELLRPSDNISSDPIVFWYKPQRDDEEGICRKRRKTTQFHSPTSDYRSSVSSDLSSPVSSSMSCVSTDQFDFPPSLYQTEKAKPVEFARNEESLEPLSSEDTFGLWNDDHRFDLISYLENGMDDLSYSVDTQSRFNPDASLIRDIQNEGNLLDDPNLQKDSVVYGKLDIDSIEDLSKKFSRCLHINTNAQESQVKRGTTSNEKVKQLIKNVQISLMQEDKDGNNVLHSIIKHQKEKITCLAVLHSACQGLLSSVVNHCNRMKQTPLHVAVIENSLDVLDFLLKYQADINTIDEDGNSVLHLAAEHAHPQCLEKILQYCSANAAHHSVDVNQANFRGLSPLHYAIKSKSLCCVKLLLNAGAKVGKPDETSGRNSIHLAVLHAPELLEVLVSDVALQELNQQDNAGYTALHFACMEKLHDAVCILVKAGADPSIPTCSWDDSSDDGDEMQGKTAMELAENDEVILSVLKDASKPASLSSVNGTGDTAAHVTIPTEMQNCVQRDAAPLEPSIPDEILSALQKLCDPPNNGWESLAMSLGFEEKITENIREFDPSPTLAIINHFLKQSQYDIEVLKNAFEIAGLKEANHLMVQFLKN